jgi:hypothetical protein
MIFHSLASGLLRCVSQLDDPTAYTIRIDRHREKYNIGYDFSALDQSRPKAPLLFKQTARASAPQRILDEPRDARARLNALAKVRSLGSSI